MSTQTMPESITATRTVSYDVQQIVQDIAEAEGKSTDEVTLDDVMDRVMDYAAEDLPSSLNGITYLDENGGEIWL